jgi:hypothetical protein
MCSNVQNEYSKLYFIKPYGLVKEKCHIILILTLVASEWPLSHLGYLIVGNNMVGVCVVCRKYLDPVITDNSSLNTSQFIG